MKEIIKKHPLFFLVLGILAAGFLIWYFWSLVVCIVVAGVISIIGQPVVGFLDRIHFKKIRLPHVVSVILTMLLMIVVFLGFLGFLVPLILKEVDLIRNIDTARLVEYFQADLSRLEQFLKDYGIIAQQGTLLNTLKELVLKVLSAGFISNILTNIVSWAGLFFFYFFTILFLAFFFMKDRGMLPGVILSMVPLKYLDQVKNVLHDSRKLLTRYFTGLILEVISLSVLVSLGLTLIGVSAAIPIGFFAGLMNIIPYVGYLIATVIGIILAVTGVISTGEYAAVLPIALKALAVLVLSNMIDNSVFQPFFFGKSVNAHPVEIFLVIIAAGMIGGVVGMIVAVPTYTFLRIVAMEFFSEFRFVRKLTDKLES